MGETVTTSDDVAALIAASGLTHADAELVLRNLTRAGWSLTRPSLIQSDSSTAWADVFQSGGLWHFNIFRTGETVPVYTSRFIDGHAERSVAVRHAADLLKAY